MESFLPFLGKGMEVFKYNTCIRKTFTHISFEVASCEAGSLVVEKPQNVHLLNPSRTRGLGNTHLKSSSQISTPVASLLRYRLLKIYCEWLKRKP